MNVDISSRLTSSKSNLVYERGQEMPIWYMHLVWNQQQTKAGNFSVSRKREKNQMGRTLLPNNNINSQIYTRQPNLLIVSIKYLL